MSPHTESILVTGANGFIGQRLCARLVLQDIRVLGTVRDESRRSQLPLGVHSLVTGDIADTEWHDRLGGICAVVHLAARVHMLGEEGDDADQFHRANVVATTRLATAAAAQGVQRFVFLSSAGVAGLPRDEPYREDEPERPTTAYAASKLEAERALARIGGATGMRVLCLRTPMVYGPEAPGNFGRLIRLLHQARGVPLPLGSVHNRRSFIFIENLIDAIENGLACDAARGSYYVSDGADLSTTKLLRMVADATGVRSRLMPFSPWLLRVLGRLAGREADVSRLLDSLCVSTEAYAALTGWTPRWTTAQGLRLSLSARDSLANRSETR